MQRLVIAVEPQLLASSLAEVFGGTHDVVLCDVDGGPDCVAGLAIASGSKRHLVDADVVISLPDLEGNGGLAVVWHGDDASPVQIGDLADLIGIVAAAAV